MRTYTNQAGVSLSLAVFLATDTYDGKEADTLSATTLLKPIRQVILSDRVPPSHAAVDVLSLIKSRMGTAIHDSIEKSWTHSYKESMAALGYPQRVIDRVVINPAANEDLTDKIPVYMEQRRYKMIEGIRVSGKFDFVAEGRLEDFKSTSVNTWINNNKDEDYVLQGSIYRWLAPDIITQDTMAIQFIFTDWQPGRAKADPRYPARPTMQRTFKLMSMQETEAFVANRIRTLKQLWNVHESQLPLCNDKELWRREPQWKYYKNPAKTTRSTKNFDNAQDAYNQLAKDKHVGLVKEVPGEAVACRYCPAFPVCSQKDQLIASGDLKL